MIVRKEANGDLVLVGQTDHSRFVGQLAAHWGNERFAAPKPFDSVARAATYHDYGWLSYETAPIINQETGEVPDFRALGGRSLDPYQWCIDWLSEIDPYSGLIVSMHRTGLWKSRYETIAHPRNMNPRALGPAIEAFIAKNEAVQERERKKFDEDEVWNNYRLLQVWDLLGLYFGCQDPGDDYIEPVPVGAREKRDNGVRLSMKAETPRKVAFDPYPFDMRGLHVQMSCKRLTKSKFASQDEFRHAYFAAPAELMDFELV